MLNAYVNKIAKEKGISIDKAEEFWDKSMRLIDEEYAGVEKDSEQYIQLATGIFKKMAKIEESTNLDNISKYFNRFITKTFTSLTEEVSGGNKGFDDGSEIDEEVSGTASVDGGEGDTGIARTFTPKASGGPVQRNNFDDGSSIGESIENVINGQFSDIPNYFIYEETTTTTQASGVGDVVDPSLDSSLTEEVSGSDIEESIYRFKNHIHNLVEKHMWYKTLTEEASGDNYPGDPSSSFGESSSLTEEASGNNDVVDPNLDSSLTEEVSGNNDVVDPNLDTTVTVSETIENKIDKFLSTLTEETSGSEIDEEDDEEEDDEDKKKKDKSEKIEESSTLNGIKKGAKVKFLVKVGEYKPGDEVTVKEIGDKIVGEQTYIAKGKRGDILITSDMVSNA